MFYCELANHWRLAQECGSVLEGHHVLPLGVDVGGGEPWGEARIGFREAGPYGPADQVSQVGLHGGARAVPALAKLTDALGLIGFVDAQRR